MLVIQILLVALFALAVIKAVARFRVGDLSVSGLFYWVIFWFVAAAIVVVPDSTFYFAKMLGIGRGSDLVVYLALVLLFFLVFKLMTVTERQKKEITELTRQLALKDEKNNKVYPDASVGIPTLRREKLDIRN